VNTWDLLLAGSIICSIVVTNNVWKISHEFDDAMSQHDGADDELTLAQLDHSRCEDKDAVQLRRQARDMETQMLEMKGSRNESLSVAIAATDVCQTALEVVTRRDEGVTQELEQTRRDLQQAQIQAKRALLRNESAAALSNMTGDPVELFLKDSDDELRNTMIMKLSIALEVEISDLQELSSTELLKRAKKHLATDRAAECEDLAPEVMQQALVEFREVPLCLYVQSPLWFR
jgi:hypothetical protein